ncbi:MAG: cyclic nucleotide-binding domain-containing protein [Desulfobulbaceae bacterium]|nr:cyclic nucleotide-binding domain-containing protein [Desulfobulbaceae bacterium]
MNSSTNIENEGSSTLEKKLTFLQQLPFFRETPLETIRLYAYLSNIEQYEAGEPIVLQGEPSDRMFIILSGQVSICQDHHGRNFYVQTLSADGLNYFGELALLAEFEWFYTASTISRTSLLTITREAFHKVMEKYPELLPKTVSSIVRLRIKRFIDQTHYLLDHLKEEAWKECIADK